MSKTRAWSLSNKSKGAAFASGMGYKGVLRRGSKYGWKYEDGKTSQSKGGFDTPEEAAYDYDEFLLHYVGPNADTNQALGFLKLKTVLEIREKIRKTDKPVNKADKRANKIGACGFKGVSKHASKVAPFKAQCSINGKYIHIGTFPTAEAAARAYDNFMLRHHGHDAITNIKLGLLPPIGEEPVKPGIDPEEIIPEYKPYSDPESERLAQIEAARAMVDIDEDEETEKPDSDAVKSEAVEDSIHVSVMGDTPAPASIPETAGELLVLSDAERLREQAANFLRQAAELETGDIKRQAAARLDTLSVTTSKIQTVMMSLIDCCADIETEIQELKKLLK